MNITIDKSIFDLYGTPDVDKNTFRKVLHAAEYRYHTISLSKTCDIDDISIIEDSNEAFFLQDLFFNSITYTHEKRLSDCIIKVGGENEEVKKIFNINEAYEYIMSPAEIIVENALNDGRFIRTIELHFDPDLEFEKYRRENVVHIDNAGGSGDRSRIEDYLENHHGKPKFLHCFVIVDGDKRYPGDDRKLKQQEKRLDYYKSYGVQYHVWEKRSMENYMPDEVFVAKRRQFGVQWVDSYLHLLPEQKDFFCISGGFSKDIDSKKDKLFDNLPDGMKLCFDGISKTNFQNLLLSPQNTGGNFKDVFPKNFEDAANVRRDTLMARTSHQNDPDELLHISQMIRQII